MLLNAWNARRKAALTDNSLKIKRVLDNMQKKLDEANKFEGLLSLKANALVETLEGKRVEAYMTSPRAFADECGLTVKKLDTKLERTLLHSYRKDLSAQVSAETDPVALLPKVVSLLYIQFYSRALQAPGRTISVAITKLKRYQQVDKKGRWW